MKNRILQLMKNKGMSQQEFSRATGISPASLSSIFNGRTAPTMKHAEAMHRYFPQLSMSWLLFGEGQMFPATDEQNAAEQVATDGADGMEKDLFSGIADGQESVGSNPFSASLYDGQNASAAAGHNPASGVPSGAVSGSLVGVAVDGFSASHGARTEGCMPYSRQQGIPSQHLRQNPQIHDTNLYHSGYAGMSEMVKIADIKQRKIVEIRIFFDDGTFETFKGNE